MRYLIASIIGFVLATPAQGQGAIDGYLKGKKETDFALTWSNESFDQYYFGATLRRQSQTTRSASFYMAHGLSNRLNLIVTLPYMRTNAENSSLQDAIVALKYRTKRWKYRSGQLNRLSSVGFSFPVAKYPTNTDQPIGQRAVAFMLRHLYQYQANSGFFVHLQTGFDFRLLPETQFAVPLIFRSGYAHSKFYVDFWTEYYHTMNTGVDQGVGAGTGSRYLKIGGTFYYPLRPWVGAFIGGAQYLTGRNIGKATRFNVGIVLRAQGKKPKA